MKLQENLSCRKGDGGSFFHTSYGVAQIQIKRATVKVRQGKIYVGKLPTEVSKSKQIDKHVTFDSKKNYISSRVVQLKTFALILSSLAP